MIDKDTNFEELIGVSRETGSRIMGDIISTITQVKDSAEHIKLLVKDMNQMEKELFLKGFLFAMFSQNLGKITDMLEKKMKDI